MMPENMETRTVAVTETGGNTELEDRIRSLMAALHTGEVRGREQAIKYLEKQGIDNNLARAAVRDIKIFMEGKS
jgi:L-asparaginase II